MADTPLSPIRILEIYRVMDKYETQIDRSAIFRQISNFDSYDYVLLLINDNENLNGLIRAAFAAKLGERRGVVIEDEQTKILLDLYSLYAFTDKLIIGSFDLPNGRKLRNLLDCGIATEQELIDDVILGAM